MNTHTQKDTHTKRQFIFTVKVPHNRYLISTEIELNICYAWNPLQNPVLFFIDKIIVFSILMYKDVEQTERLLRAIYRPQNVYCIHVDKKSADVIYRSVESIIRCLPNVELASVRVDVQWGTWSLVESKLQVFLCYLL